jgi:hypothetical protein
MWIWICGPYASQGADVGQRAANLRAMNLVALEVFRRGHVPILGANRALPIIVAAGADDASYDIRRPLSLALIERCDACWRIGGPSTGADEEVAHFLSAGKAVYRSTDEVPPPGARA